MTEGLNGSSTPPSIENKENESLSHLPPPAESLLRSEEDLEENTSIPPKPSLSTLRDVGTKHQDFILKKSSFSYKHTDDSFADIPYLLQTEQDSKEDSNFPALPLFCELNDTENTQQDWISTETLCSYMDDSSEDVPLPSVLQSDCQAKENSDFPPLPSFCSLKDTLKANTHQNYTSNKATFSHRNANQFKDDEIITKSNLMTKELGNISNWEKQRDCSQVQCKYFNFTS